ncbi:MAG: DUF805 domain-containing protein [Chloroflexi bacterium]|nr:DUF805 domain-containing protein [Chloroflexota bacterium]
MRLLWPRVLHGIPHIGSLQAQWAIFSFDGRLDRRTFWLKGVPGLLVFGAGPFAFLLLAALIEVEIAGVIIALASYAVALYIGVALTVNRLHDCGLSGRWLLVALAGLMVIVGVASGMGGGTTQTSLGSSFLLWLAAVLGVVGAMEGTDGPNEYGEGSRRHDLQGPKDVRSRSSSTPQT